MSVVHTTRDYNVFKRLVGNREINPIHVDSLMDSIKTSGIVEPIKVNENMEIIDGQHRLEALQQISWDVPYTIHPGYNIEHVQRLNNTVKAWTTIDYIRSRAEIGVPGYDMLLDFLTRHDCGIFEMAAVLRITQPQIRNMKSGVTIQPDYERGEAIMAQVNAVKPFYDGYKRRNFVIAIAKLYDNPNFNFEIFLRKLQLNPTAMKNCTEVRDYIDLIEEIYNFRNRHKVSLKY